MIFLQSTNCVSQWTKLDNYSCGVLIGMIKKRGEDFVAYKRLAADSNNCGMKFAEMAGYDS